MNWQSVFLVLLYVIIVVIACCNGQHFKKFRRGIPPIREKNRNARAADWGTIQQRVDHFNPSDLRTWTMRYMNNSQFYQSGAPIFIFLGGEWEISEGYIMGGQMFDMAEEHNGYMFYTEHRYYGFSFPTPDFTTENLQFLNIDQALADVMYFIEYQKNTIPGAKDSKVVVVGGSYSATMATWARLKYPHLVDVAYSSSAPLRAVADFYEYFEVVSHNLGLKSEECVTTIREAIEDVVALLETEQGITTVSNLFLTCDTLRSDPQELAYFFMSLSSPFASLVQYASNDDIETACSRLTYGSGTSLQKFADFIRLQYAPYCLSDYEFFVEFFSYTGLSNDGFRSWYYQTCTEYGFYQTSNSDNQPFGNTFLLDFYLGMCRDLLGIQEDILNTGIERTNLFYGSTDPEITHVVSVHGTVDPWHPLGVLEDINPLAPVIVVEGTSHCADLSSVSEWDPPQLVAAKIRVKQLIAEWLSG